MQDVLAQLTRIIRSHLRSRYCDDLDAVYVTFRVDSNEGTGWIWHESGTKRLRLMRKHRYVGVDVCFQAFEWKDVPIQKIAALMVSRILEGIDLCVKRILKDKISFDLKAFNHDLETAKADIFSRPWLVLGEPGLRPLWERKSFIELSMEPGTGSPQVIEALWDLQAVFDERMPQGYSEEVEVVRTVVSVVHGGLPERFVLGNPELVPCDRALTVGVRLRSAEIGAFKESAFVSVARGVFAGIDACANKLLDDGSYFDYARFSHDLEKAKREIRARALPTN